MGFLDRLLGRSAPPKPDLDQLFGLPSAALTLEAAAGYRPTGVGSVAFRATEGAAFAAVQQEIEALLSAGARSAERTTDEHGYTWFVVRHDAGDVAGLVTDLHAVNSSLEAQGFGPFLLCSLVGFTDDAGESLALVYLYKRGTFYPFAPRSGQRRDTAAELQIRGVIADDLRVEPDLSRWFPVWGAPGL